VPGDLGRQRRVAVGLQRLGDAGVQPPQLTGQQMGADSLDEQCVPRPAAAVPAARGEQRRRGQLTQRRAYSLFAESGDPRQLRFGERTPGHSQRREHRPSPLTHPVGADVQQLHQATGQLTRQRRAVRVRRGQRRGDQLLGQKRVAPGAGVQLLHQLGRPGVPDQAGHLLSHLVT
jgi:hypothetical protein